MSSVSCLSFINYLLFLIFIINWTPFVSSSNPVSGVVFLSPEKFKSTDSSLLTKKNWKLSKSRLSAIHKARAWAPCFCSQQLLRRQSNKWKTSGQIRTISALRDFTWNQGAASVSWCCKTSLCRARGLLRIHDALFYLTERLINLMWQGGARQCCKCHSAAIQHKP